MLWASRKIHNIRTIQKFITRYFDSSFFRDWGRRSNDNCLGAQNRLIQNIKSVNEREFIEEINAVIEKEMNSEDCGNSEDDCAVDLDLGASEFDVTGKLSTFLQELEDNCKWTAQTGARQNPYWCPNFANSLLRISKPFTLWTCMLAPNGTIATSSRSEDISIIFPWTETPDFKWWPKPLSWQVLDQTYTIDFRHRETIERCLRVHYR